MVARIHAISMRLGGEIFHHRGRHHHCRPQLDQEQRRRARPRDAPDQERQPMALRHEGAHWRGCRLGAGALRQIKHPGHLIAECWSKKTCVRTETMKNINYFSLFARVIVSSRSYTKMRTQFVAVISRHLRTQSRHMFPPLTSPGQSPGLFFLLASMTFTSQTSMPGAQRGSRFTGSCREPEAQRTGGKRAVKWGC